MTQPWLWLKGKKVNVIIVSKKNVFELAWHGYIMAHKSSVFISSYYHYLNLCVPLCSLYYVNLKHNAVWYKRAAKTETHFSVTYSPVFVWQNLCRQLNLVDGVNSVFPEKIMSRFGHYFLCKGRIYGWAVGFDCILFYYVIFAFSTSCPVLWLMVFAKVLVVVH